MIRVFSPSKASGKISAPPSKSMAHRLLICAGLSKGESVIKGVDMSGDVRATVSCLERLGAKVSITDGTCVVRGVDIKNCDIQSPLDCSESGSTLRFFIPVVLLTGKNVILRGSRTLLKRPLSVYEEICAERGLFYSMDEDSVALKGPLASGHFQVKGNISSQFISGLLFALPMAEGDSVIELVPPVESGSYIDLTVDALKKFGVSVDRNEKNRIGIKGGQKYTPIEEKVEGDYSNAAFLDAFNLFGGSVEVEGLSPDSLQGDRVYRDIFKKLSLGTASVYIGDCPDLGPILFALAAAKHGGVFTGIRRLRMKESDRVAAMTEELEKFGASVTSDEDSLVIYPESFHRPSSVLNCHNDHRIAMSLSVLLSATGGEIEGFECVNKSYPGFYKDIEKLGVEFTDVDR